MTLTPTFGRRTRFAFHSLGLSCLGGAVFLQVLVFTGILQNGSFIAVEANPAIIALEIALTVFALLYFVYIYQHLLRSVK